MKTTKFLHAGSALGLALLCSCHNNQETQQTASNTLRMDTILVADSDVVAGSIKTTAVGMQDYSNTFTTAGMVKTIPTAYAEIASPFSGRVVKSYLSLGKQCTPQTPLFELSSPDFFAAQKTYFQEKSQLEQAKRTLQRQKDLMEHGVGAAKDLEEAQTAYDVEKREYENAVMGIRVFKANPETITLGQPLTVYAPINGEILENKVVLGQFIKDDGAAVAKIAALGKVWIAGQVKEKDLQKVRNAAECSVTIPSLPDTKLTCKIFHIGPVVDDETRSIEVLMEADNSKRLLSPGMYVTVEFFEKPAPAVVIPSKAVFLTNESNYVFVATGKNRFVKRKIKIMSVNADTTVIQSGLTKDESIVTDGGLYLQDIR
ncbi:cobalt-zinc-cadmium efflux system membrane fusion protein [Chitinophaga dinghuensis]|uniref:Cobalt-zinc-cadmium efflux system membrane fusion protein n=1 Tax=Chitinophaga dinghuensis TaxID=1539050 RepID=A0A327W4N5_9BACT|nr:efflux RND transporter periplasmic adaptor subunit [Chitinophaga dinghuensis]RAJ83633.1 cobalt-zinc-cadmium efflux system membrane fusion protein [Chitinophaga dinghuensis]